jgi:hypothetical protein
MRGKLAVLVSATVLLVAMSVAAAGSSGASPKPTRPEGGPDLSSCHSVKYGTVKINNDCMLSSGGRMFFDGPNGSAQASTGATPSIGTNVDAADPTEDVAGGQSETSIGAAGSLVLAAWNDASVFFVGDSKARNGQGTGVGFSSDGGLTFTDLQGLPNNISYQRWFGDPTVVAIDSTHFVVGSLYLPDFFHFSCSAHFYLAVSVAIVKGSTIKFTFPIIAADGGSVCDFRSGFLDKEFLSYDSNTRTLAMSYTNFVFNPPTNCGNGQIQLVEATVPAAPGTLSSSNWSAPIIVSPEIGGDCSFKNLVVQEGAYPAVAPNGDIYVAWERNWFSNLFNGDPYGYIMAAYIPAGATSPTVTKTVSLNQVNSTPSGGVHSMTLQFIAGYNRGVGNDFPRIAYDSRLGKVEVVWNDSSLHPLGDIWLKSIAPGLADSDTVAPVRIDDDNSYALHFLPAVSIRSDGSICTSWYDRRLYGGSSTLTDYFGECRAAPSVNTTDFVITTGPTDWNGTSSIIIPNFGDYTDNASTGLTTYYLWSDGRLGVPQPFADSHT